MTVTPGALPESEAATVPPSPTPPVSDESVWRDRALGFIERYALVIVFGLTFLFFCVWPKTSSAFLSLASIRNVLADEGVSGILAIAIIVPLSCGEFDFSVGNNAGLTQVLCAWFIATQAWSPVIGVLVAIAVAAFVGLSNGNTVARIGVNSLIVTLGVSGILLGIDEKVTGGQSITVTSPGLIKLGTGYWFGIPRPTYYLAFVALGVYYMLEHTPYGRYLHSIGSNRDAARLVGLRVERYVLLAFVISGTLAGVAGVLLVARNGGGSPQVGTVADTLQALAAAYLGATAIKPGRFNVVGTLVAIFFLAFTVTGLSLAGVADWIGDVFDGAALFVAVLISTVIGRKRAGIT